MEEVTKKYIKDIMIIVLIVALAMVWIVAKNASALNWYSAVNVSTYIRSIGTSTVNATLNGTFGLIDYQNYFKLRWYPNTTSGSLSGYGALIAGSPNITKIKAGAVSLSASRYADVFDRYVDSGEYGQQSFAAGDCNAESSFSSCVGLGAVDKYSAGSHVQAHNSFILDSDYASIDGGSSNRINKSDKSSITGGYDALIKDSQNSHIWGGYYQPTIIGGNGNNYMLGSSGYIEDSSFIFSFGSDNVLNNFEDAYKIVCIGPGGCDIRNRRYITMINAHDSYPIIGTATPNKSILMKADQVSINNITPIANMTFTVKGNSYFDGNINLSNGKNLSLNSGHICDEYNCYNLSTLNTTGGVSGGMDYTNLAMTNKSNDFGANNLTANVIRAGNISLGKNGTALAYFNGNGVDNGGGNGDIYFFSNDKGGRATAATHAPSYKLCGYQDFTGGTGPGLKCTDEYVDWYGRKYHAGTVSSYLFGGLGLINTDQYLSMPSSQIHGLGTSSYQKHHAVTGYSMVLLLGRNFGPTFNYSSELLVTGSPTVDLQTAYTREPHITMGTADGTANKYSMWFADRLTMPSVNLPTCSSTLTDFTNGATMRNATGLYYCNGTTSVNWQRYVMEVNKTTNVYDLNATGRIRSINATAWSGYAVCYLSDGTLGHCTTAVGVGGTCTCAAN